MDDQAQYTETLLEPLSFLTETEAIAGSIKRSPEDFIVIETGDQPPEVPDGKYTILELELRNWETNRAIKKMTKRLGISRQRVGFGGTKDKRAVTRQLISIRGGDIDVSPIDGIKDMTVIRHYTSSRPMKMGDHRGNRFIITIRECCPGDQDRARATLDALREQGGFPNYFGAQRFGTLRPVTHIVGKHITQGDIEGAVMTYLGNPFPAEPQELQEARRLAEDPDAFGEALKAFPVDYTFERAMLHHLTTHPGDYIGALNQLPRNLTLMFVHAYQGHLFNRILSLRISEKIGMMPVVGDRVLPVGKDGLPEHGSGIPVTEANLEKMRKRAKEGKGFVSALVIGTDAELAGGVQGGLERQVLEEELGFVDRGRFVIPEIPRLTTKGTRREILCPLKDITLKEAGDSLVLEFELNKGCYATSLLRELFKK